MDLKIKSLLITILLLSSILNAVTPVVEVVTSLTKSGGIYGDGTFNVIGNKVNGREICSQNNTNANIEPGCDMLQDTGYNNNNTQDPTDDFYTGDLIVRTSDIFELKIGWSILNSTSPVTLTSTLPSSNFRWEPLPSSCGAGSSISTDRLTMTCVRSNYADLPIAYSQDLPFNIKVKASTMNGTKTGLIPVTVSSSGAISKTDDPNGELTVTASPKWNIQNQYITYGEYTHNGVFGYKIIYGFFLEADEVAGEDDTSSAVLGNEALGANFALSFSDTFTTVTDNSIPNSELIGCRIGTISGQPYPFYKATLPERSLGSLEADLSLGCTQGGGKGTAIAIDYQGIDASLNHVATKSSSGSIIPLTRLVVATGIVEIFVPEDDVKNATSLGNDTSELKTKSVLTSFDPNSISTQSNFNVNTESTKDNKAFVNLIYRGPGYTGGNYYKRFMKNINEIVPIETTTYSWYSADGMVTPNREFAARVQLTNSGNKGYTNSILCDVIDSNTYDVIDIVGQEGISAMKPAWDSPDMNYTVEYATGYVGTWPPPLTQNNSALVIDECRDSSIVWHSNTADARAIGPITKIRMSIADGVPGKKTAGMYIKLKVRGEDLSGNILPNNTNLVNYMAVHDDVLFETRDNNWSAATRILNEYPIPASGGDYKADRAVLTRAIVRTVKELSLSIAEPGNEVDVNISSTFTSDHTISERDIVYIREMLDPGLNYIIGSSNVGDPTFGTCDDLEDADSLKTICTADHQVLVWNLGEKASNEPIPDLTYKFILSATVSSGTSHTYTIISSPADVSNVDIRKSNKNITVTIPAELIISKEVNTPFREIDESPIEFTTFLRNGSSTDLTSIDIIDIIPFNGDGQKGFDYSVGATVIKKKRVAPTSFNGTLEFIEARGEYSCSAGVTWFFSNDNPSKMDISPVGTINMAGGSATWCQGTSTGPDGGCGFSNANVTAVRLTGPDLSVDASCAFKIFLKPRGNKYGDIYTNTAGAFAQGVSLPVLSNDVSAIVPTIALGDYVWIDTNANGIQDASEQGVGGITLELLDENDNLLKTTTSNEDGQYIFDELTADTKYKVKAVTPSYYTFSPKNQGGNRKKDSDVDADGITDFKSLNLNQYYKHFDIGLTSSLKITGRVYTVGDSQGIENTEVKLYKDINKDGKIDTNDKFIKTIQIPSDGTYEFTNIFNGNYVVGIFDPTTAIPAGYELVTKQENLAVLVEGENVVNKDFPYAVGPDSDDKLNPSILTTKGPTDIEDLSGTDADGTIVAFVIKSLPDSDEGILYLADGGTEVKVGDKLTVAQANGLKFDPKYGFIGTTTFTYSAVDDTDLEDSTPATVTIPVHGLSNIGDTVWYDDNKDGQQDDTEFGVNGVEVTLYDSANNLLKVVLTDENGKYVFRDLKAGTYSVGFSDLPSGYKISPKDVGADDKDSDADPSTGKTGSIVLAVSSNNLTVDMGIFSDELSVVGDTVWYDDDKDGIQDDDELGANGVKVTLYKGAIEEATTITDASGSYIFRGVKNGTYTVGFSSLPSGYKITQQDQGVDDTKDSDVDVSTGKTGNIVVTTASVTLDVDMGIYSDDPSIATLGDTVWYDDNQNGIQDVEELGVNGVKVSLYDNGGNVVKTTVTDSRGTYLFRNLIVGTYTVGFNSLPSGYKITQQGATSNDKDSDVNPLTGKTANVVVTKGLDNLDVDMGIYSDGFLVSTLGDTVWYDDDKDGVQDGTELGASGVKVTLYSGATIVKSTVTDKRGTYLFRDVISGDYTIEFTDLPLGYKISPKAQGGDIAKDSDVIEATGKTDIITVTDGSNTLHVDMGIYSDSDLISSIGDTVWYDDNKDGLQDSAELGAEGVKVTLYDARNNIIKTTLTNAQGTYIFRDLLAGDYTLGFTSLPSAYKISPKDNGGTEATDSDVNATTAKTDTITLAQSTHYMDVDMGIYSDKLSTLGDTVWFDTNKDGIQDSAEFGASGVKVTLYQGATVVQRTVTNDKGSYIFRNLLNGDYTVEFSNLPSGYKISPKDASTDGLDSDANQISGKTGVITVTTASNNLDVDMGIYSDALSTIGDTVWYDDNKDGIQDDEEQGAEGIKVTLFKAGVEVKSTVTNASGTYIFRDLLAGTYIVEFTNLPNAYKISPKDAVGSTDITDSDVDSLTGVSTDVILGIGSNNLDVDMGIYSDALSTIGDTVWYDDNKDGIQDSEEKGAEGIKVILLQGGVEVKSTVTNASGTYIFRDLLAGTYKVQFTNLPNAYKISPKDNGVIEAKDSDVDTVTGISDNVVVAIGSNNLDVDMGIYSDELSTIGDTVWYDDNKDGIQDSEEKGAEGIKVILLQGGVAVKSTVTNASGTYIFRDLLAGTYKVQFTNLPNAYKISPKDRGIIEAKDSDVDTATGISDNVVVTIGSNNLDVDMGIYSDALSTIGDTVWYDDNKDGIQDSEEKGAEGIKVILLQGGVIVKSTVTNASGTYIFRDLLAGTYKVQFTNLPNAYKISPKDNGIVESKDSDVDTTTGISDDIPVTVGSNNLDIDMGIFSDALSTLGDTVWYDDNKDGVQDAEEKGAEGIKVILLQGGVEVKSTVTNASGTYIFRDLLAGTYKVQFTNLPNAYKISPKDNNGRDDVKDSDIDTTTGISDDVFVAIGSNNLDVDMGIFSDALSTIGDTVWYDDNKDGIQDAEEKGAEGIKVILLQGGVEVKSTVTNASGTYIFRDLLAGTYKVQFTNLPNAYKISPKDNNGRDDVKDSDVDATTGISDDVFVAIGSNNLDVDMGIFSDALSTLGDTVWFDDNKDGIQDAQEQGAEGIKVTLFQGGNIVKSTVTNASGTYIFRDLLAGIYTVQFTDLPTTYKISPKDNNLTDDLKDSDVDTTTGVSDNITVAIGSNNLDIDMGIYSDALSTIGDTVWYDSNKDGVQDATEKGVEGVKVTLYDTANNVIQTTVTDSKGTYVFRAVKDGSYSIKFTDLPSTYKPSPKDATTDNLDSDVDANGLTDVIVITVGLNKLNIDMGIYSDKLSTIGDTVWYDDNKDGVQDATEKGAEGIKVTLFDSNGDVVETAITTASGTYIFRDVLNGTYSIVFTDLPTNYKISPIDATVDDKDSDADTDGKVQNIVVTVGTNKLDVDMGIYSDKLSSLGDSVWYDTNKDGVQNDDESGVEGVKATLYSGATVVQTTVTDSDGVYMFRNIVDGTYTVGFSNLPNNYKISPKDASSEEKDSDVNPTTRKTDAIVTSVGSTNLDVDMGIYTDKLSTIGDTVWYDDNKDGIQNPTESGVEGVKVSLYDIADTLIQKTETNSEGSYIFRDIVDGTYYVTFTNLPVSYKISPMNMSSDEKDSDAHSDGTTDNITTTVGSINLDIDMGIYSDELSTIGDSVWYDDDKDGIQDIDEHGVEGVKAVLHNSATNAVVATTVTDRDGVYLFRLVKNGTYYVAFSDLPNNYKISPKDASSDEKDSDVDPTTKKSDTFTTIVGTKNLDIDMGIYSDALSVIGDSVWYDDNKDGIQDDEEFGAEGIQVALFDAGNNILQTAVTDRRGAYVFRDIREGTYYVEFSNLPNGYKVSPKDIGSDTKDSDIDTQTLKSDIITVTKSSTNLSVDMGIYSDKLSIIGDSVWYDDNKDGIQDETEFGAEGIKVTLYIGNVVVQTAVTDRRGAYVFRDVREGTYFVGFSNLPNGYKVSPKDKNSDDKDSDINTATLKSDAIVVTRSTTNLSVDMGIYSDKLSIIGDSVWYDDNKDGVQNKTEFGAEGINVVLYSGRKVVQTAVTDRRGTYIFRDIIEGTYTVGFSNLPNGYKISPKNKDVADKDSDVNPNGKTDDIVVTRSSHNLGVDMGIYSDKLSIIGDSVWYDDNKNGIQDETEFGAEGIDVALYLGSKVVQTAVTDRRGTYIFRDIIEGTYTVGFSNLPNGYRISPKNIGVVDKDSDVNSNGKTDDIIVTRSSHNLGVDMGIYSDKLSIIGDSVWYDDNKDGIQDETEFGVEGLKVVLYADSKIVQTVVTDRRGTYIFRDIVEGTYTVGFSNLPNGYKVSPKDTTTDDKDSDINVATGKTDDIVVTTTSHNLNVDMGIYSDNLSVLGDSVWYDDNKDGIQDETESGVEGIKVTLYSGKDIVQTVVTDRKGTYTFRDILNGSYTIGFSNLPTGYKISPKGAGTEDKDSNVNVKTAKTDTIVVTVGSVNLDVDMGIYSNNLSNIGDSVWYDSNKNGVQEEFETGVEGVKVTLFSSTGKVVQTRVTDERGVYTFRAVVNGTYTVGFSDLPTGFQITQKDVGADIFDSDVNPKTGKSDAVIVSVGSNNLTVDMGIYSDTLATIGNSVWYDDNRNGVQDSAEKGVNSVKVALYTKAGLMIDVTTTDSLGAYHFYRVVPDSYYLIFSNLPVGYKITAKDIGNNEKDSDADLLTGQTVVTKLDAGENDLSWDMGIYNEKRATLGDTVWYDDNKNGLQDAYERGVGSIKITLYNDADVEMDSTVTDNKGNYKFSNLIPGDYYMLFSDLPISYEVTTKDAGADSKDSDVDPTTLKSEMTTLIAGENDLSWDMGIYDNKGASIGDTVWYDDNANGIQDAYELGAEDILVRLFTEGGAKVDTVITDDKGGYSFRNLVPGSYYVEFAHLPVGYEVSPQDAGDDAKDSDVDASTRRTAPITVAIGENMMDLDLGIFNKLKGTIGDMVWYDTNHNGLQDMNETGVNGIKVSLFNSKKEVVATKVTSKSGQYLFRDLVAGEYFVEFSEFPLGYMITKQNVKDSFLSDSDANYHRGQTELTTLDAGENDLSWDLGLYVPKLDTIKGRVWDDINRNGIQESDEPGMPNIRVTAVKNDILQIPSDQTTTATVSVLTDKEGTYLFKNLESGAPHHYYLVFDDDSLPSDYSFSEANQGDDDTKDSDVDPDTGLTPNTILGEGLSVTYDAGIETLRINDDVVNANTEGGITHISILSNDGGNIDSETVLFVGKEEGEILYNNGTAVGGVSLNTSRTYVVEGEGTWSVESDGTITFTAEQGFTGIPGPVYYIVQGASGNRSNIAKIDICTPCAAYRTSTSVDALSYGSMLIILFAISLLGLSFARREFEVEAN